ncbi:dihydrodipicolinate synthase family protein [Amycolatopsis sp. NPDC049253]|uniref:dihydrodipicolinate synthase family protein n=1 Tax=Amycolatopsis sp. NPDC049253 TaxID=3155274 RepID=UPI003432EA21
MPELQGILVPLITPFTADGRIATDALEALAESVLDAGATGLVALGTTGEPSSLDAVEKQLVIEVCAAACHPRGATLIVGTDNPAQLTRWPDVTAALVTVPPFTRPGEAGVLAHFTRLAATSPVPLVIYHVPYRTAQPLSATTLRAVGSLPNVAGVKLATGTVDHDTVSLLGDCPPDFAVLAGDDVIAGPLLALGAAGGILASAHLATADFVALHTAWSRGDLAAARELGPPLARLSVATFAEPNPTVLKGALHALGRIPTPDVRLPLLPAAPESVESLVSALRCGRSCPRTASPSQLV